MLHVYARLFLDAASREDKEKVFRQAVEWLENKAETTLADGLKDRLLSVLCSTEGEQLLRWATGDDKS